MYTHGTQHLVIGVPGTPVALTGVAVVGGSTCPVGSRPIDVREIGIQVAVAITVTAVIAQVIWRPDPASATGQVVLGTITVPVGTPIGTVVRKRVQPGVKFGPGGYFVLNVTQAATAGTGYGSIQATEANESAGNVATALESA